MGLFDNPFSKRNKNIDAVVNAAHAFMKAAMALVPDDLDIAQVKKVVGFGHGVIDYLSQSAGLDQEGTVKAMTKYMNKQNKFSFSEKEILEFGVKLQEDPVGVRAWSIGGNAIKAWMVDNDENAPLRLVKLVDEE